MPYGKYIINEIATFEKFGYYTANLTRGSNRAVCVNCDNCKIVTCVGFRRSAGKHLCESIIDNKKYCFKCKQWLELKEFSKNRHRPDGYQKICKECFANYECVQKGYAKKNEKKFSTIDEYMKSKITNLNNKIKTKKHSTIISIVPQDLVDLFYQQGGMCFYTGIKMHRGCGKQEPWSLSVDRKDPSCGYIKENIVLCCNCVNSFKSTFTQSEFSSFVKDALIGLSDFINRGSAIKSHINHDNIFKEFLQKSEYDKE